jgi:hypothetical protein
MFESVTLGFGTHYETTEIVSDKGKTDKYNDSANSPSRLDATTLLAGGGGGGVPGVFAGGDGGGVGAGASFAPLAGHVFCFCLLTTQGQSWHTYLSATPMSHTVGRCAGRPLLLCYNATHSAKNETLTLINWSLNSIGVYLR